jgi:hypothetical protein
MTVLGLGKKARLAHPGLGDHEQRRRTSFTSRIGE